MKDHDVSDEGFELLTRSASKLRTGTWKSTSAGRAAATPLPNSSMVLLVRYRSAHQPTASTGIQVLSRVKPSSAIAAIQSGSQRSPRSNVRIAAAKARISSVRPQL